VPFDGPWAISYSDGIPRHPVPVYEMLFHFFMGFVLIALWRRQVLFGRLFALYLASYGVFRFFSEFLRETPKAYGDFSAYQIMALMMIMAGGVAVAARTLRQPASWERWRVAARETA
jgi:prolipoprotein diacylglyceryltransferase